MKAQSTSNEPGTAIPSRITTPSQTSLFLLSHLDLPPDYRAFLERHDGGAGFLANGFYLILWKANELEAWNKRYGAPDCVPGFFLIGSDGGGEAIAFDPAGRVVRLPFIPLAADNAMHIADNFTAFIAQGVE
ncbi:MAG TPA: SMI1/KNR4 family protein [Rhizomicrobium sp.]|nr:SMI1/KNR4 family protein [Rhizomicrobium sp.]